MFPMESGHFMGMIILSAMDWSAAQMSGADYDGDFAFLIIRIYVGLVI
jgi:hypothetical protein